MKAKRLPRLWCAMQGLLPLEACRWVEMGELAWPRGAQDAVPPEEKMPEREKELERVARVVPRDGRRKHVAARGGTVNGGRRGSV